MRRQMALFIALYEYTCRLPVAEAIYDEVTMTTTMKMTTKTELSTMTLQPTWPFCLITFAKREISHIMIRSDRAKGNFFCDDEAESLLCSKGCTSLFDFILCQRVLDVWYCSKYKRTERQPNKQTNPFISFSLRLISIHPAIASAHLQFEKRYKYFNLQRLNILNFSHNSSSHLKFTS